MQLRPKQAAPRSAVQKPPPTLLAATAEDFGETGQLRTSTTQHVQQLWHTLLA